MIVFSQDGDEDDEELVADKYHQSSKKKEEKKSVKYDPFAQASDHSSTSTINDDWGSDRKSEEV